MNRKLFVTFATTALASVIMLGAHEKIASARTIHAISGNPFLGSQSTNFNSSGAGAGVTLSTGGSGTWYTPLVFDTAGGRTITVRGQANAGGGLTCVAAAIDITGAFSAISSSVSFPASGVFTSIALSLPTVPFGGTGVVSCSFSGNNLQSLLSVDYTP
jgi:hypothetical protein